MDRRRPSGFVLLLVGVSTALLAVLVAPFAASFFAAAVLAGVLHPTKEALAKWLGGRSAAAAVLVTTAVTLVAVAPPCASAVSPAVPRPALLWRTARRGHAACAHLAGSPALAAHRASRAAQLIVNRPRR